jgi:hypothetical protein
MSHKDFTSSSSLGAYSKQHVHLKATQLEEDYRQLQSEIGSKAQQTEFKVERKLMKEARLKYQSFRLGQSEIRDLNRKKLLDFKNFEANQLARDKTTDY